MKKLLLSLLLFVVVNYSSAQWSSGNTNFPYSLFDVSFFTPNMGFAVGEQGSILKTTDFGQSWNVVLNVPGKWFTSVHHFSPVSIIACGSYGAVYLSQDEGNTWVENSFPDFTKHLRSIKLGPDGRVWTVGFDGAFYISPAPNVWFPPITQIPFTGNNGRILKTTNAGLTWEIKNHMLTTEHLRDVDAVFTVGTHTVVAVGDNGTIIRSADDGETWSLQTMMPAKSI